MIELRRLREDDADLAEVADGLNAPEWEDFDNRFSESSLRRFLKLENTIYLVAYVDSELAGASHAYLLQHPAGPRYLYVDEVDTLRSHRRKGVATAMMRELLRLATELGAEEAWLGADEGNEQAYALYRGLKPGSEEPGAIFTYETRGVTPAGS